MDASSKYRSRDSGFVRYRDLLICHTLLCLVFVIAMCCCTGCSLFVMAGKAMFGDPAMTAQFRASTGIDLTKSETPVVIICDAPHGLKSRFPSLQVDIVDRVTQALETHDVNVVPAGDVASWFDDHGEWGDFSELAEELNAEYVIHIAVRELSYAVPQSPDLLQGAAEGNISVHRVSKDGPKSLSDPDFRAPVSQVFNRDFRLKYPESYPVPRQSRSEDLFVEGFLDRMALNIAQHFYDHRVSERIH